MDALANIFKALSEGIRLRIIALLTGGELCVCDLMAVLDLPQSTISRHLSYLKNAGLVGGERRGVWMYYRLREPQDPGRTELLQALTTLLAGEAVVAEDKKKLAAYLETKKDTACG